MASELISDGLAVGYFYNFIKRMFDSLSSNSEVKTGDANYPFPYEDVLLEILIPNTLTDSNIEKCKELVYRNNEVRLSIERGRDMSFFVENPTKKPKKVVDFPTTIDSIIEFLKIDADNLSGFLEIDRESEDWKERENLEVDKFKSILEFLINSYTITQGKVIIRNVEE